MPRAIPAIRQRGLSTKMRPRDFEPGRPNFLKSATHREWRPRQFLSLDSRWFSALDEAVHSASLSLLIALTSRHVRRRPHSAHLHHPVLQLHAVSSAARSRAVEAGPAACVFKCRKSQPRSIFADCDSHRRPPCRTGAEREVAGKCPPPDSAPTCSVAHDLVSRTVLRGACMKEPAAVLSLGAPIEFALPKDNRRPYGAAKEHAPPSPIWIPYSHVLTTSTDREAVISALQSKSATTGTR